MSSTLMITATILFSSHYRIVSSDKSLVLILYESRNGRVPKERHTACL